MKNNISYEKEKILNRLKKLSNELLLIQKEYNVNVSGLLKKINNAIKNIENQKFSIAFFGAFSDGKSTIISALTNRLDIKISPKPTTDKIEVYNFEDYEIIDTPGLFSENLMHDELTKKYISEANVVLYTIDPVNPLKESHSKTVKWILKDLNKINSTIFVINKMDEVADLEDDEDFEKHVQIKKEVVLDIINEITGYKNVKVVAISADPYGQGLEFWQENIEEYKKISRIEELEKLLSEFIDKYKDDLIIQMGVSVIKDTILQLRNDLKKVKEALKLEVEILSDQIEEYENRVNVLERDINNSYSNIKNEIIEFREELLTNIDVANELEELAKIIQNEIGKDGYIFQEKINLIVQKHTQNILTESKNILSSLEDTLNFHMNLEEELLLSLSPDTKIFIKGIFSAPTRTIADGILKIRDFLNIPIKFKPWGAIKAAKFLKGIPVILEILDTTFKIYSDKKFRENKKELKDDLEEMFKGILESISLQQYVNDYFPYLIESKNILSSMKEYKQNLHNSLNNIKEIDKRLAKLMSDF